MPPTAILASASLAYVAYTCRSTSDGKFGGEANGAAAGWKGIVFAAAGIVGIVPYTLLFMNPTNNTLIAESNGVGKLGEGEVRALVGYWSRLNLGRGLIGMAGTAVGIWSAVGLK